MTTYAILDAYVHWLALQEVMLQTAGLPDFSPTLLEEWLWRASQGSLSWQ